MYEKILKKHLFPLIFLLLFVICVYSVRGVLLPFFLGLIIAYCFKDFVNRHENRVSRHTLSLLIIVAFSLAVIVLLIFCVPAVVGQLINLTKDLMKYFEGVDVNGVYAKFKKVLVIFGVDDVSELKQQLVALSGGLLKMVGGITNGIVASSVQVFAVVFMIFVSPIVAFYFLRDWNRIVGFLLNECVPKEFRDKATTIFARIDNVLHHYIVGQISVCAILGCFYSILLFFIEFKYSFVVGIASGFLTILPYFGTFLGGTMALILGYLQFGFVLGKLVAILLVFCVGQFLEGNFITPNLIGNRIKVHPLWLIFAVLVGGAFYGFWGVVISMPLAAVIGVLIRFYFEERFKNCDENFINKDEEVDCGIKN